MGKKKDTTPAVTEDEATTPPADDTIPHTALEAEEPKADETVEGAPKTVEEAAAEEFPSLAGFEEVEIAERAADIATAESPVFARDHLILAEEYRGEAARTDIDRRNASNLVGDAIRQGLRVSGDAKRVSVKKHPDGVSLYVRYEVPARPAAVVENSGIVEVPNADTTAAPGAE
jgi:hypothetical protein